MIKLTRGPEPQLFSSEKMNRAKELLWNQFQSNSQRRINFQMELLRPIKKDLSEMTRSKCAYCESNVGAVSDFDIENFRPKSGLVAADGQLFPNHYFWLAYEWTNLLPSCRVCNASKSTSFPLLQGSYPAREGALAPELALENPMLIDPCTEEPFEHLHFDESGKVIPLSERGAVTIQILNLNREPLVNVRAQSARTFKLMLSVAGSLLDEEISDLFSQHPRQQFAALLRNMCLSTEAVRKRHSWLDSFEYLMTVQKVRFAEPAITASHREMEPFTIKTIEVKNFRKIEHLNFTCKRKDTESEKESWMLFLGDNGVGKSSILQAIALTLAGEDEITKLNVKPADILRMGQSSGYVKISSHESPEIFKLEFTKKKITTNTQSPASFLMGYGATRLLPKGKLAPAPITNQRVNVQQLFDYSYSLLDVKAWLSTLEQSVFRTKICPALVDILDLGEGESIDLTSDNRLVITTHEGSQDLEILSDGYKSIVALACDIMKTLSLDSAGYHNVPGIVLIDELGNHLHPRWRTRIVYALRSAFPKLQFIVSTHEPLCLRGTLRGEVFVIRKTKNQPLISLDQSVLPDHTVMEIDQLLTSDFFGLLQTFDPQTEKRFSRYYDLLVHKGDLADEEQQELSELTDFFAGKDLLGNTPQMQALYSIVNETFAKSLVGNEFKTTSDMKQDTIDEIRGMLQNKGTDWL